MAKVRGSRPLQRQPSLKGRFYRYTGMYGDVAVSWPPARGAPKSELHKETVARFASAVQAFKASPPDLQEALKTATLGSSFMPRDIWMRMVYGAMGTFQLTSGKRLYSMATRVNMSMLLDNLADAIGTILYKGTEYWEGIPPPTEAGLVLTTAAPGSVPPFSWQPGGGGGGGSPDYLIPLAATFPTLINAPTLIDTARGMGISYVSTNNCASCALMGFDVSSDQVWLARLVMRAQDGGNNGIYLMARDATTSKLHGIGITNDNVSQCYLEGTKWNSETSYSTGDGGGHGPIGPVWVAMQYTASTKALKASISTDGANFVQCFNDAAWLANPNQIGFAVSRRHYANTPAAAVTYFA